MIARSTHLAALLEGSDELGEQRRDVVLANLLAVAGHAQAHADLDLAEHALELALRRVLAEPPGCEGGLVTSGRGVVYERAYVGNPG